MVIKFGTGFNRYPAMKVRPLGISGNVALISGLVAFGVSTYILQISGNFMPRILGAGFRSPQGRIPMDLTPDELLAKRNSDE